MPVWATVLIALVGSAIGGGGVGGLLLWRVRHRQTTAETGKTEAETADIIVRAGLEMVAEWKSRVEKLEELTRTQGIEIQELKRQLRILSTQNARLTVINARLRLQLEALDIEPQEDDIGQWNGVP